LLKRGGFIKTKLIQSETAQLLVVDLQEKFIPVIPSIDTILTNTIFLVRVVQMLNLPITLTEQNPRGLGKTITKLADSLSGVMPLEKMTFSCWRDDAIRDKINQSDRSCVIMAGIETSVCILQTGLDLLESGYDVCLPVDCIGARKNPDHELALQRLQSSGAILTTAESLAFELIVRADGIHFKPLLKLIKEWQS
jgi:nicotinamidase-related amidase